MATWQKIFDLHPLMQSSLKTVVFRATEGKPSENKLSHDEQWDLVAKIFQNTDFEFDQVYLQDAVNLIGCLLNQANDEANIASNVLNAFRNLALTNKLTKIVWHNIKRLCDENQQNAVENIADYYQTLTREQSLVAEHLSKVGTFKALGKQESEIDESPNSPIAEYNPEESELTDPMQDPNFGKYGMAC